MSASNAVGLSLESIRPRLPAGQRTSMALEVGHIHSWQCAGLMNLSGLVVLLMHLGYRVDDVWLDGLFVDDGLDDLMDIVMSVLASNDGFVLPSCSGSSNVSFVLELGLLCLQFRRDVCVVTMLDLSVVVAEVFDMMLLW